MGVNSTNNNPFTAYGLNAPYFQSSPQPIIAQRAPTTSDFAQIGTIWVDKPNNDAYILTSVVSNTATWIGAGGGSGTFTSLTVTPGPISLTGATTINTSGAGTTTIGTGGTGVVAIGNATGNTSVTGSLTASTGLTATTGNIVATAGAVSAGTTVTAGTGITATTGNITATTGNVVTTNGSAIINDTDADANSAQVSFNKSRSGGIITSGDALGAVVFSGNNGTTVSAGASIEAITSGTIGADRVPTGLAFFTHEDAPNVNTTLRMTIEPDGTVVAVGDVKTRTLFATGDQGTGTVSTTAFTNVTNTTQGIGVLSILSTTGNNGNNAGFIKAYVGTTVVYIPYFINIAP